MYKKTSLIPYSITLFFLFTLAQTSCVKDLEVDFGQKEEKIVVNCFFSPDSIWKAYVGKTTSLQQNHSNRHLTNATVEVYEGNKLYTKLEHDKKGYYLSDSPKPIVGKLYTIKVTVPEMGSVEATDEIPQKVEILTSHFDTIPTIISTGRLFQNIFANPLKLGISEIPRSGSFLQLRSSVTNIDNKTIYTIDEETLNELIDKIPDNLINKLSRLLNTPILGKENFYTRMRQEGDYWDFYDYKEVICDAAKTEILNNGLVKGEEQNRIFPKNLIFENIAHDSYMLLGNPSEKSDASAFDFHIPNGIFYTGSVHNGIHITRDIDLYIELQTLSFALYEYQKSYIQQITNRVSPFATPVPMYNNIEGGVGIFAGYQLDRAQIYVPKHNLPNRDPDWLY